MSSPGQPKTVYLQDYAPPVLRVDRVDLTFELGEVTIVRSRLQCVINSGGGDCVLWGEQLETLSLRINGETPPESAYRMDNNTLTLYSMPEQFVLETEVRIRPRENTSLTGLYQSGNHFCTQCEAEGFRRITWFPDRPDVMARYTTTIIAEADKYPILLSNGNLIEKGVLTDGKHWVKWEDPFRKPSYLFALVAGDFDCLQDSYATQSGRVVALQIYVEKGALDKSRHAMQALKKAMRWDETEYGREYDLDTYMIVAVSDFNMGAMENKGLNIFNTRYVLASPETATDHDYIQIESVIAHEYFHNWTGNRITCRDWFQLSLKEGLTVFRDQCFTADTTSSVVARIDDVDDLRNTQFVEDAGPLAHPVRPDSYIEINNFYTATVYNKGAEVIRMIRCLIGPANFRKGMDLYFARHDGEAVTIEDFVRAHEEASGRDLGQFRLWYSQAGTPVLEVEDQYDPAKQVYTLTIRQSCQPTPGQPDKKPLQIPVKMGLIDEQGKEWAEKTLVLTDREHQFVFETVPSRPVPSLLREFSAPVRVQYPCQDESLATLFRHDTDLFNRREAGFQYVTRCLLRMVESSFSLLPLVNVYRDVFRSMRHEPWLLSRILQMPGEKYLSEQMKVIDVDGIHAARKQLRRELAVGMRHEFRTTWEALSNATLPGERALKNSCLGYLALLDEPDIHQNVLMKQFNAALGHDMTDTIAALSALMDVQGAPRDEALTAFYERWKTDALVMDKWFALQAGSQLPGTLDRVKALLKHPAFDITNPNRVYALIGTLGGNVVIFHGEEGAGYQFLTECVLQLDPLNPQVAARMLKPLTGWQRHTPVRQHLMREALTRIARESPLSPDVYELVSKTLQAGVTQ